MADEVYEAELAKLRDTVALVFPDPEAEAFKASWRQVVVGFRAGWDARERTMPAPAPAAPPPAAAVAHQAARAARSLKVGETVYVRPFALIEHRATGAIYLDPLFDVRDEPNDDYCIQITVEGDGVIARGPINLHRETNDKPGKPGLRLVKTFLREDR